MESSFVMLTVLARGIAKRSVSRGQPRVESTVRISPDSFIYLTSAFIGEQK
jgi:hypothetical protein